jgi:hypothetical protein
MNLMSSRHFGVKRARKKEKICRKAVDKSAAQNIMAPILNVGPPDVGAARTPE